MKDKVDKIKELKALIIVMGILLAIRASFTYFDFGYYGKWNFWNNFPHSTESANRLLDAILHFGSIIVPIINIALPILLALAIIIVAELIFIKNEK